MIQENFPSGMTLELSSQVGYIIGYLLVPVKVFQFNPSVIG